MVLINQIILFFNIIIKKCVKTKSSNIETDFKKIIKNDLKNNNSITNRKLIDFYSQKINNFITIYNPYDTVTYISSVNNQNVDLFITNNSDEKGSKKRLI